MIETLHAAPSIDYQRAAEHLTEVYRPAIQGNADGLVALTEIAGQTRRVIGYFPPGKIDGALSLAWLANRQGRHVYGTIGLVGPENIPAIRARWGRPREAELSHATALFADIDAGKGENYPPQERVIDVLRTFPLKASLVNLTGRDDCGLHAFWLFDRAVDLRQPGHRELVKELSLRLQQALRERLAPFELDRTADLVRLYRLAGTTHHKYGETVRPVVWQPDRRYSPEEIDVVMPELAKGCQDRTPVPPPEFLAQWDRSDVIERARRYCAKVPPAKSGEHGHKRTFALANRLVRGLCLSPDDAFPVLAEWNLRCDPPWSDAELGHKLADADEAEGERGFLLKSKNRQATWRYSGEKLNGHHNGNGNGKAAPDANAGSDTGNSRSLDEWRAEMARKRLESVGTVLRCFDGSPVGAGKTTADVPALAAAGMSLTVLPTHRNTKETAEMYRSTAALNAIAYPPLTEETCQQFPVAERAMSAGLTVTGAVCPTCPHFDRGCEYQEACREARDAQHSVCTHQRFALQPKQVAAGRQYLTIHEDPVSALRPIGEVSQDSDFMRVADVARLAKDRAKSMDSVDLRLFFDRLEANAVAIAERLACGTITAAIEIPPSVVAPAATEARLFYAMEYANIYPPGVAMRLALAATRGELHSLTVRIDRTAVKGKREEAIHRTVIGVWQTPLPPDAAVWIADATSTADDISELAGEPFLDMTPVGTLRAVHPVRQIPRDVTIGTSPGRMLALLRAILAGIPSEKRIGLITHQRHLPAIRGTAKRGPTLEEPLRNRITRTAHYRSGASRGSNDWIDGSVDLLVVLGTPRVPPQTVRTRLIQQGRIDAAARDGDWGEVRWTGTDEAGATVEVSGRGYRDAEWAIAHRAVVAAEILQAAGRARWVCQDGRPALVVTTENLGLTLLAEEKNPEPLSEATRRILEAIAETGSPVGKCSVNEADLSEHFPIYIIGKCSVSSVELAASLQVSDRLVRRHLIALESSGLVSRIGKRGGWQLTQAGASLVGRTLPEFSDGGHQA